MHFVRKALVAACCGGLLAAPVGCGDGPERLPDTTSSQEPAADVQRPFAKSSFWNAPIPEDAQASADSAALVRGLRSQIKDKGTWFNTTEFSSPVYEVGKNQKRVRVRLDRYNPALQAAFDSVPIPPDAKPAKGSDGQMVIWQPSTDTLWEFWKMRREGGQWVARWGGRMTAVSKNPGYFGQPHPDWGAAGTSLPLLGGLVRIDEVKAGRINHALALAVPHVRKGAPVFPAQRSDGDFTTPDAIPEGTRFQLDPEVDVERLDLPPLIKMMARAAQTHGIVVRDQSGAVVFEGEDPSPTGKNPYEPQLDGFSPGQAVDQFPWERLRVVPVQR
jgi:hypothetical protein